MVMEGETKIDEPVAAMYGRGDDGRHDLDRRRGIELRWEGNGGEDEEEASPLHGRDKEEREQGRRRNSEEGEKRMGRPKQNSVRAQRVSGGYAFWR